MTRCVTLHWRTQCRSESSIDLDTHDWTSAEKLQPSLCLMFGGSLVFVCLVLGQCTIQCNIMLPSRGSASWRFHVLPFFFLRGSEGQDLTPIFSTVLCLPCKSAGEPASSSAARGQRRPAPEPHHEPAARLVVLPLPAVLAGSLQQ